MALRYENIAFRLGQTVWRNKEWLIRPERFKKLLSKQITIDELAEQVDFVNSKI